MNKRTQSASTLPEYVIGKLGGGVYTVAKFEQTTEPTQVYKVEFTSKGPKCDCPAWTLGRTRPCKHCKMVQDKLNRGELE